MSMFFSYVLLGLSLAAPIGPINAAQLDKGIKKGFLHSWLVGIGAMVADCLYMLIIFLGISQFINTPFMQTFLSFFGFFVLVYTGIESILTASHIHMRSNKEQDSLWKSFFSGFFMSLFNPLSILFWLGIYGSVLARAAKNFSSDELFLYSFAIIIGLIIWDLTMATIASTFRRYFATRFLTVVSIISGVSLIGFGFYFGWQGVKALIG